MCLEESDLVSKVLSVLHHHSLCGGLIWHAESPLASPSSALPDPLRHILVFPCPVWSEELSDDSVPNVLISNSGIPPGLHSQHSSGTGHNVLGVFFLWNAEMLICGHGHFRPTDSYKMLRAAPGKPFALLSGCEGISMGLPCAATTQIMSGK